MLNLSEAAALENRKNNVRRSTRLSLRIPIVITSLDPAHIFSGRYDTAVVNAHGCGILLPELLETGKPVSVQLISSGRSKNGRIVLAISIAEDASWLLGVEFDIPESNFWEVENPPADW
ncbi:MAG: hypothetical protein JWQ87_261, partial [Candidatus Sulfotelmatobacter sp.]|nr:hypothetical protein [Candidatus Sulfotelmatobacter sp.]